MLNLFAYTCGVGLSAAAGGAREVCNLDFAEGNLAVGRENGLLNLQRPTMEFIQSDYFPAIRQLAGLPISQRRGRNRRAINDWNNVSTIWYCSTRLLGPRVRSVLSTCCATTRAC